MYTWNSIVDYLKSIWKDSSKTARQKYAQDYWISSYDFSAQKNIELLNKMRQSQTQKTSQPVQNYSSKTQNNYNQQNKSFTNNQVKDNFWVSKNNINTQKNSSQNQMEIKNLNTEQKKNLDNQLKNLWYDDNQIQDYYKKNKINYSQEYKNKSSSFGWEIKRKENEKWDFWNSNILPSNITWVQTNKQKEDKKYTPVQSFDEWVQRWKKPTELVDLVENKYWINAEYDAKNNKILWYDKNWNLVKSWTFDEWKNPIRTDHKVYTNDDFLNDFNNILATWDNKQIWKFLQKNKKYYDENKDYVTTQIKQYIKQKEINDKVKKLSSLDWKWLWNASINWEFVQWDDVFNALPYEKQQEFLAFQKRYVRQDAKDPNKKIIADLKSDDAEEVYNKMGLHNPKYRENFQKIVLENKDRKRLGKEALSINEQINKKRAELQKIERKTKEKYPSASPAFIQAMINRDSWVLLDEIEDLKAEYDTTVASYNMVNADAMAEYQAYQMDAQVEYNTYQSALNTAINNHKELKLEEEKKLLEDNQKLALLNTKELFEKFDKFNQKVVSWELKWEYVSNNAWLFFKEENWKVHQLISWEEFNIANTKSWLEIKEYKNDDWTITSSVYDPKTKQWSIVTKDLYWNIVYPNNETVWDWIDLRNYAKQFPNEAWSKTNNPSWITWEASSKDLKEAWADAWIIFKKWTSRPSKEWWHYVEFDSIQDWLMAQWIALSRNGWDIEKRLKAWVWTSEWPKYAEQVMRNAWIEKWTKFEDLNAEQKYKLQKSIMLKESPWLYSVMQKKGWLWEKSFLIPKNTDSKWDWQTTKYKWAEWLLNVVLPPKITEWKYKSYEYATRMAESQADLIALEEKFMKKWTFWKYYETYAPNLLKSEEQQLLEQNQKDFIAWILRKDTWAAVTDTEFEYYSKIYLPQPWDKDRTIRLKQVKRDLLIKALLNTAWTDINWTPLSQYYDSPLMQKRIQESWVWNIETLQKMQEKIIEEAMKKKQQKANEQMDEWDRENKIELNNAWLLEWDNFWLGWWNFSWNFWWEPLYDLSKWEWFYRWQGSLMEVPQNIDFQNLNINY